MATVLSVILAGLILGWPVSKILRRLGFSGWWALLAFVPLVNFVSVWVLAFSRWPIDAGKAGEAF
jgi:uncharacterized membrane protein YhaH (DUF805 family)